MPIRAVVFDLGGVLEVNPRTGWVDRWARRLATTPDEFEERLDVLRRGGDIGSVTLAEIERRTSDALNLEAGRSASS